MKRISSIFMVLVLLTNVITVFAQNNGKEKLVLIKTDFGEIKCKLYNETPIHRDNFIELAKNGKYDDSNFHRIIKGFMIQGGAIDSEVNMETLPAEITKDRHHKRGALAAARQGDETNPEKKSSPTQFYIVQGRKYQPEQIDAIGGRMKKTFSDQAKVDYASLGGSPHLDGDYTVFGEVVEGMNVVDKIAAVEKQGEAPKKKILFTIEIID